MATTRSEFVDYLLEMLTPLKDVHAKRMFGGFGIYRQDLMFGLVSDDTFYLKVDEGNKPQFVVRSLMPFSYTKQGKILHLSYYAVPSEAMDDVQMLCEWSEAAHQAAMRAAQRKNKKPADKP